MFRWIPAQVAVSLQPGGGVPRNVFRVITPALEPLDEISPHAIFMKYCRNIAATVGAAGVDQLNGAWAYCIPEICRKLNAGTRAKGVPLASIRIPSGRLACVMSN